MKSNLPYNARKNLYRKRRRLYNPVFILADILGFWRYPSDIVNTKWKINATNEQYNAFKGHKGMQYSVFNTANNHILDCGMEGFNTTHDRLEAEGFFYVGTNRTPKARRKSLIITTNGVKFGFVAATYSLNGRPFPDGKDYLVNFIPFHRFKGKVDVSLLEKQISHYSLRI